MNHPEACDMSRGDKQCNYIKPNGDGYLNCALVIGHKAKHRDCYDESNNREPQDREMWLPLASPEGSVSGGEPCPVCLVVGPCQHRPLGGDANCRTQQDAPVTTVSENVRTSDEGQHQTSGAAQRPAETVWRDEPSLTNASREPQRPEGGGREALDVLEASLPAPLCCKYGSPNSDPRLRINSRIQMAEPAEPAAAPCICDTEQGPYCRAHPEPQRPEGGGRVETGVVQFDDDWPGVFIRGDNAFALAYQLGNPNWQEETITNLRKLLDSCDVRKKPQVQYIKRAEPTKPENCRHQNIHPTIFYKAIDDFDHAGHGCNECGSEFVIKPEPTDASAEPYRYVGSRNFHPDHWSKAGFTLYAIEVPHPNGAWEAIFCKTAELAEKVVIALNSRANLCSVKEAAKALHAMLRPADQVYYDPEKFAAILRKHLGATPESLIADPTQPGTYFGKPPESGGQPFKADTLAGIWCDGNAEKLIGLQEKLGREFWDNWQRVADYVNSKVPSPPESGPREPRCPKCGSNNIQYYLPPSDGYADKWRPIVCDGCAATYKPETLADFAQFFPAAPGLDVDTLTIAKEIMNLAYMDIEIGQMQESIAAILRKRFTTPAITAESIAQEIETQTGLSKEQFVEAIRSALAKSSRAAAGEKEPKP